MWLCGKRSVTKKEGKVKPSQSRHRLIGLGRHPFKVEIAGSNPAVVTNLLVPTGSKNGLVALLCEALTYKATQTPLAL